MRYRDIGTGEMSESMILVKEHEREWQCIDCGHVETGASRLSLCRGCWSWSDGPVSQFIPRAACGWLD